ncbi:hypothetical protein TVVG_00042 [Tetraselmis viridis virus SI1]|uniref:hypothetical protein n=1 Tax=Tetraselmis viridis virus S20 TaxID=754070 RepID=UPI0002C15307|nr:hypothetical protein TVGG_00008 [Tetraselmis viridis virus S20]AGH31336.1 hypothetical protein TVGG_00008 [Tetraselmis viridis virus S20]AGH31424.1 hypothetical protein TVVG_00042 [Tetraselmis viridis virus SI1]
MTKIVELNPAQRRLVHAMANDERAIRGYIDEVERALNGRDFSKVHELLSAATLRASDLADNHTALKAKADK